jgi:hypothetical protein
MFGLNGRRLTLLALAFALVFAAAQYVPAYFAAFQFKDHVRQEVKFAGTSKKTMDALRNEVLRKAAELGIPLTKNNIRISRRGPSFTLETEYHWPIDLKVYRHELVFRTSHTGELFENASN